MKDARGHGSDSSGTTRGQSYRDAVSGFNRAAGTWAQGILDSAKLAAHQTGIGKLKTTDEMMTEHDKIWGKR